MGADPVTTPALPNGFMIDSGPALPDGFVVDGGGTPPAASSGSGILDFFKQLGSGAARGLAGFSEAVAKGNSADMGGTGVSNPETPPDAAAITAPLPKPEGTAGQYGDAIGETLGNPLSYVGPGGLPLKLLTGATSAVGSKFLGDLAAGSPWETPARILGGVVGGATPSKAARAITPFPAEATRLGLVKTLKNEGVPVTAGEKTGNMGLRYVENYLKPDLNTPQAEAFTRAALKRAGINADRATPEVMDAAHRDIGNTIETIANRNTFQPDQRLAHDVVSIGDDYENLTTPTNRAPVVKKYVDEVLNGFAQGNGTMPGAKYQQLRSDIARAARSLPNDPKTKFALQDLTGALDDAFERGLSASGSADVGKLGEARRQYRNLLVLDRAAGSAGEAAANGLISPAQLASATKTLQGKTQWVRGKGDFADLTRAGQGVMKPLPDSGTAWRNRLASAVKGVAGAVGAGIGGHVNGWGGAGEGGVLGLLLAEQLGEPIIRQGLKHAAMNPLAQWYLGNQGLPAVPGLLATAPLQPFTAASAGR